MKLTPGEYFRTLRTNTSNRLLSKVYYRLCSEHFSEYNSCASPESLKVSIESLDRLSEEEFQELGESFEQVSEDVSVNTDWLIDETEKWCKDRKAVYLALMDAISIHDGSDKDRGRDAIPQILSDALAIGFDDHVGHDYLGDYNDRYDFYHLKEERLSFGLEYLDKITGGIPDKTLNIIMSVFTLVSVSLFLCVISPRRLYFRVKMFCISLEMAEERIAERIDANLLDIPIQDIRDVPRQLFETKVHSIQKKTQGKLFIKEYPTASAHAAF